jgi:hypothetical protein
MASQVVENIRKAYKKDMERVTTHYEGCYQSHWSCAIARLLDVVESLEEQLTTELDKDKI